MLYLSKNDESFNKIVNDVESRIKEIIKSNSSIIDHYQYLSTGAICFSLKHPGFKEECEYRIYSYLWNRAPLSHKGKRYIKFYFSPSRVRRIVIGPSEKQITIIKRIEKFLSSHNEYKHVDLAKSTIPFITK
jgi:hypothetical protein